MTSKRLCEQNKMVVIFSDLPPDLVAKYMGIYKDWLRARLRLREYFRVVMREFHHVAVGQRAGRNVAAFMRSGVVYDDHRCVQPSYWCHNKPTGYGVNELKAKARAEAHELLQYGPFLGPPSTHGGTTNANSSDLVYRRPYLTCGCGF